MRPRGVSAPERTHDLRGGITIKERWFAWDEARSFAYEGIGVPLLARARDTWTVIPAGDQTLLTSQAEVVLKGGRMGQLLEPIVAHQMNRRTGSAPERSPPSATSSNTERRHP
jgi:hypothetical protein